MGVNSEMFAEGLAAESRRRYERRMASLVRWFWLDWWPPRSLLAQNAAAPPAAAPVKKAMFWKVSSADNVAYLLGSIHLGSKDMYPLAKEIEDAFERSAALIVEVDINHVDLRECRR